MWMSGTRPACSLTMVKLGLATRAEVTSRPRASPCTKAVLPAPRSPESASTSPPLSTLPSRAPSFWVAARQVAQSVEREVLDQEAGHDAAVEHGAAHRLRAEVARLGQVAHEAAAE